MVPAVQEEAVRPLGILLTTMEHLTRHIRVAGRQAVKRPGFTGTAVLILG